jgi:hypothetical protein
MLATLAALHLLVLSQTSVAQAPANPPLPRKPQTGEPRMLPPPAPGEIPPAAEPPAQPAPPAATPPAGQAPAPGPFTPVLTSSRQLSLLAAESLQGGSAMLAEVGWSSLNVLYGQGITRTDDLGALASYDWAKTELRLGGFYRRPLGVAGAFDVGLRLGLAWYADLGKTWVYSENHRDRGLEVAPALILSTHAAGGILSLAGEAPVTATWRRDSGLLFTPRVWAAYEAPLYGEFTVGARGGLGYRGGSGDAPLKDGRGELTFLVLGGWRVF